MCVSICLFRVYFHCVCCYYTEATQSATAGHILKVMFHFQIARSRGVSVLVSVCVCVRFFYVNTLFLVHRAVTLKSEICTIPINVWVFLSITS